MKTHRIAVSCHPPTLHESLEAAGMKVATVRADWANAGDPVALWAVVVFAEGHSPDSKKLQAVLDAHLKSAAVKGKKPSAIEGPRPDKEKSLAKLEQA